MKILENYGVLELNIKEVKNTEGGVYPLAYVALWLAWEAATNPQDTWSTLQQGFNSYSR